MNANQILNQTRTNTLKTGRKDAPIFSREGEQIVRIDEGSQGYTFLDTAQADLLRNTDNTISYGFGDFSDIVLSLTNGYPLYGKQIEYVGVSSFRFVLDLANLNERNRYVQFYSSVSTQIHTVDLLNALPGFSGGPINFLSVTTFLDHIRDSMNTVTGASGLTFSYAVNTNNPIIYNWNAVGGNFYFTYQSNANVNMMNSTVLNGMHLWNPSRKETAAASHIIGPVWGMYTRYIDIVAPEMVEHERIPTSSTGRRSGSDLLFRIYLNKDQAFESDFNELGEVQNLRLIRKPSSKSIQTLRLQLYDEHGYKLILPGNDDSTPTNSYINITTILY